MNAGLKGAILSGVRALGAEKHLRALVKELDQDATRLGMLPRSGKSFTDGRGQQHDLLEGFRDLVKPGWRQALRPASEIAPPTQTELSGRLHQARNAVRQLAELLRVSGGKPPLRILEVGCYDGAKSFAMAERFGCRVTASDITAYYQRQVPGEEDVEAAALDHLLGSLREGLRGLAGAAGSKVEFVEDDIAASKLPDQSFDLIASWEVLEHLADPAASFRAFHRLLVPGGMVVHEYNPFFCFEGGHSLCTLDFPWGHVLLTPEEFRRFVEEHRPEEVAAGCRFFTENLNRMCLRDLRQLHAEAGFEEEAILIRSREHQLALLTREVLEGCRALYPNVTLTDLITPIVITLYRKPK